jgi:hypothetical protein
VLEAYGIATETDVDRRFERIGVRVGASIIETTSVIEVERAVARTARNGGRRVNHGDQYSARMRLDSV